MTRNLSRCFGHNYAHFITFSCYRRRPILDTACRRDLFLQTLEEVRLRYDFVVLGYVAMPEHVHLLIGEAERGNPSVVVQVLKQRFARKILQAVQSGSTQSMLKEGHLWQKRFYDFVVRSPEKHIEKFRYIHRNPVKRGLVASPEQWPWSSFRAYAYEERGPVLVNEQKPALPIRILTVQ